MKSFFLERVNYGNQRLKIALVFSFVVHVAVVLLIFLYPVTKKEAGTPFVTRLITPDELKREFPQEPSVRSAPKEGPRIRERAPMRRPSPPRPAAPARRMPPVPALPARPGPGPAEKGVVRENAKGPEEGSGAAGQKAAPAVPGGGAPGSGGSRGGVAGVQRGPGIVTPSPSLREKLFDREVMGKFAKREEKTQDNSITFDTKEFKYETYMMRLKERIEGIWRYPPEAAGRGIQGDLLIRFTIRKDGRLGDVELVRTSGYRNLDQAAMQALKDGEPYWPLPDEWGKDSLSITGHFVYSMYGTYIR